MSHNNQGTRDENYKDHLYALIFCGGGGTRLWPYSRQATPKQFLKIRVNKTLIRQTYERLLPIIPKERIFVVTVPEYIDEVAEELPEIPKARVLVEPARRNTAMAAGLGVTAIADKDPKAIVANIWSDHLVENEAGYRKTLLTAAKAASDGQNLVTTGLSPRYPHTGLGYVKKGRVHDILNKVEVYKVERFIEKPKLVKAKKMVRSSSYLWHVGLLVWRVDAFMKGVKKHSPALFKRLKAISDSLGKVNAKERIRKHYLKAPDLSIDYALAEKAKNFLIVEGKFDWYDLGDFSILWQIGKKDRDGNRFISEEKGEWINFGTKESIIVSKGKRAVGTIDLTDMIVIAVDDAVLVAPKSSAQKVKKIVKQLRKEKKTHFL